MLKEFIEKIEQVVKPEVVGVDGRQFSTRALHPVLEPMPSALVVSNLSSLVEYFKNWYVTDDFGDKSLLVHVETPLSVKLRSRLVGPFEQRACLLEAKEGFQWGEANKWMNPEAFTIMLMSQFVQDDAVAMILKLTGNIVDSRIGTFDDDGISQTVSAKVGIARRDNVVVPPRVQLRPFRCFAEAEQPASDFLLRMRSGQGEVPPAIALFEADGGAWKNQAMANVRAYLKGKLPEGAVILA